MFMFLRIERPTTATFRPDFDGDVHRLLHAVHVRREAGDQDAPLADRDDVAEGLSDEPLRAGHAGPLRVRRVPEQEIDAAVSELGELPDIGAEAVDRRVVELVVARVQDAAGRGLEHDRHAVRDRVRHAYEVSPERPDLHGLGIRIDLLQLRDVQEPVLVELRLDEPERQLRPPDLRDADRPHQIRQRAYMVLVRMREEQGADLTVVLLQVPEVREDQVDPEVLVAREGEPCVDDHDLAADLVDHHVLAHFAEAAERDDSQCLVGHTRSIAARAALLLKRCLQRADADISHAVLGHPCPANRCFSTRRALSALGR